MNQWLVVAVLFAALVAGADESPEVSCLYNLNIIAGAVEQFALDPHFSETNGYSFGNTNLLAMFKFGRLPECPSGGRYREGASTIGEVSCSIHGSAKQINIERITKHPL